jgi:hypothetical protein
MTKFWIALAALLALGSAPTLARDYGVGYGHDYGDRHSGRQRSHNRSRAWIDNDRGHWRGHHGGHPGMSHDHFSPRGQGGYHWGW